MRAFFQRRWFLCVLAVLLAVGLRYPTALATTAESVPETAIVSGVLFLMALALDPSSVRQALGRPLGVGLALVMNSVALPLAAWPLSRWMPRELASGLMIAASVPCTLASAAVWTRRSGGNDTIALLVMLITNFFCFLVIPFWLWLTRGASVEVDALRMMGRLAVVVVAPMVLAQLVRLAPAVAQAATRWKTPLGVLAQLGILSIVFVGAVHSGRELADRQVGLPIALVAPMIAAVLGLHIGALALGHALGALLRLERGDRIAVGFSGSQKTLMIGLGLAVDFGGLAMLPMVAYHVCQLVFDELLVERFRRGG